MAKTPKFEVKKVGFNWMVSVPPSMSVYSTRERRFFDDEKQAEKFAQGLRAKFRLGQRGGVLTYDLTMDAAAAADILKPYGISLIEAAREVAARIAKAGSSDLFITKYEEFMLANEEHHRLATKKQMEKMTTWLPAWFLETPLNMITPDVMEKAMGNWALSTKALRKRYISSVMNFVEHHRKQGAPSILTPDRVDTLLSVCKNDQERWAIGLLVFAGVRPSAEDGEISKLDWSDVSSKIVKIQPEVAKTGSDREIIILPRLARILKGRPKSGRVTPSNWKKVYQRIRRDAGITESDVMRHTFGSNLLAYHEGNEGLTKIAMGHTAGSTVLFRYYRRAVTIEAGKQFFA